MFDISKTRDEMKKLHAEAAEYVEKFSAADAVASEEDSKAQDERFAKLEKLAKSIDDAERLARFSFSKEQPTNATVVKDVKGPIAGPALTNEPKHEATREDYSRELTDFVSDREVENYATITVSGNSAIVPTIVTKPITPVKWNAFRKAYAAMGLVPESYGNTAPATTPVISSTSGGLIPEGTQNSYNDANPSIGTLVLTAHGYQSKTYWYSNEMLNAQNYDLTQTTLPALQGAREYGFASAIAAAIVADTNITQVVTTPSTTTITPGTLDALNHAFTLPYDDMKAMFLNLDAYNIAASMVDSTGRPILEWNDVQTQDFYSYKGTPVFKLDNFQLMGTSGHVVGCAVSFTGFKLRDEVEKLIKYVDSPLFVDQTGLNSVKYQGWGYVPQAIVLLKN